MKKIAIIKIVVFSILALVVTFVLAFSIKGTTMNSLASSYSSYRYNNSGDYSSLNLNEEKVFNQDEISSIKVYWVGGNVNIVNSEQENISFSEVIHATDVEEKFYLHYNVSKKVLTIRFCASTWNIKKQIRESKDLTIYLPNKKFSSVYVETVSANISYDGLSRKNLYPLSLKSVDGNIDLYNIDTTSLTIDESKGRIYMQNIITKKISIDEISGSVIGKDIVTDSMVMNFASSNIDIKGNIKKYSTDGLSGSSKVKFTNIPESITGKFTSTTVIIEIPENEGFTVSLSSLTGRIESEFDGTYADNNKKFTHGNGTYKYNFETVSSNIFIEEK